MIVDYHLHLRDPDERIAHRVDAVEPFVETAARRGVDELGFTEHVYYFRQTRALWDRAYESERCVYDLDVYVDAVLEAKRRGLPVKLGLEVDYVGDRQDELAAVLEPYPWDFLLGSVHNVDGLAIDSAPEEGVWAKLSVEDVWRSYFGALAELASSGHVDVLAHPDLPKIFARRPPGVIEYPALDGWRSRSPRTAATSRCESCTRIAPSSRRRGRRSRLLRTLTFLRTSAATSSRRSSSPVPPAARA